MPYIPQDSRKRIDEVITELEGLSAGDVAYLFTKILLKFLETRHNYATYAQAVGILETVKLELYRRLAAPYEDKKIKENGDVF